MLLLMLPATSSIIDLLELYTREEFIDMRAPMEPVIDVTLISVFIDQVAADLLLLNIDSAHLSFYTRLIRHSYVDTWLSCFI